MSCWATFGWANFVGQLHCVKYLSLGKKVDSKYLYATQIAKSVMFT